VWKLIHQDSEKSSTTPQKETTMAKAMKNRNTYTAHQISKMFQLSASKQTLYNAEERGDIPKAIREQRGKISARVWEINQLPQIGERMGFLKKPLMPQVVSVFSLKGGTAKSSLCFQLARSFALHNVRTLVIGLDAQETITQTLSRNAAKSGAEDEGIFQILTQGVSVESSIRGTDLATLDYIPETIELAVLDLWLKNQKRKEYILKERIIEPVLGLTRYDLILLDCNPSWSEMVTGALTASDVLVSPLGADINSLKAAKIFVSLLADFQEEMRRSFRSLLIVPTMVEPNKLSQTILAKYRVQYEELCSVHSIRRAIAVQESNLLGKSLMEVGYHTPVFQDFVGLLKEVNQLLAPEILGARPEVHMAESRTAEQSLQLSA
jgi:chromosome partitioning protein